jgi:hypothetical protein
MIEHFLLAAMSGLLAFHNKDENKHLLFLLWIINCCMWTVNLISDVVKLIMS